MDTDFANVSELFPSIYSEHSSSIPSNDLLLIGNGRSSESSDSGYECTSPDQSFIPDLDKTIEPELDDMTILFKQVAALESSHQAYENVSRQFSSLSSRLDSLENKLNKVLNNIDYLSFQFKESQDSTLQISNKLTSLDSALSSDLNFIKNNVSSIVSQTSSFKQDLSVLNVESVDVSLPVSSQSPVVSGSSVMVSLPSDAVESPYCSVLPKGADHHKHDSKFNAQASTAPKQYSDETLMPTVSQTVLTFEPQVFIPSGHPNGSSSDLSQDHCSQLSMSADRNMQHNLASHQLDQIQSQLDGNIITENEIRTNSLDIQAVILNSQMLGLKSLISPSPSKDLSKSTLLDLHKNRVKAVESQTQNLQMTLCEYVSSKGFCLQLCEQVTDVIDDCISWSSKIRELYQSTCAYKKSQGSKLFDTLHKFLPNSEIDIYVFLKRFESLTEDFDFPEERAELLYNKYISSSVKEEVERYKNDYESMKRSLIHRYGNPRILISKLVKPLQKEYISVSVSDSQTYLSYYRKLQSILEKINFYLGPITGYQVDFESFIFSQDFLHTLLAVIPLDAKVEYFKAMKLQNEDTLWIQGEIAFKLLLSTVHDCYELQDRLSFFQPEPVLMTETDSKLSGRDHPCTVSTLGKGDTFSCHGETVMNTSTKSDPPKHKRIVSDHRFPCILPGHDHNINSCKEFFSASSEERVDARRVSKIKHCAICLQSSKTCKGVKCTNIRSVPDILLCQECKQISLIDRKRPCYSVLFCSSQLHRKPSESDIFKALDSYIPGFKVTMSQLSSSE